MAEFDSRRWQSMKTAPRDGTLVLVKVRATEQGPGEFDMVRWAQSARSEEEAWVAADSDPFARIVYAEGELAYWMPLPSQLPTLRSACAASGEPPPAGDETDGSGCEGKRGAQANCSRHRVDWFADRSWLRAKRCPSTSSSERPVGQP